MGASAAASGGQGGIVNVPRRTGSDSLAVPTRRPESPAAEEAGLAPQSRSQRQQFWDSFRSHRAAFFGLIIFSAIALSCVFLPFVLQSPTDIDTNILAATPPSMDHLLGTDQIGRDVLSRLVNAGRKSLLIGLFVALIAAGVGSTVGVVAGYFGGWVDATLMWFVNVLMTIPSIPLMIAVAVLVATPESKLGPLFKAVPEEWRIIIVLSALGWMGISRVVRSQVLSLSQQEFCEAAIALGARHPRVMFLHILPNSVSVIAVFTTLAVSGAIIGESALSFLGFGVQPPTATWGNMLSEAKDLFTILEYWWLTWFPALMIFVTVLSVNFIGDGVRDALDPKSMK